MENFRDKEIGECNRVFKSYSNKNSDNEDNNNNDEDINKCIT